MLDLITLGISFALGILGWVVYKLYIWPIYITPLRKIPGPPSSNPFYGNFKDILGDEEIYLKWTKKYGNVVKYHGAFNEPLVMITDPKIVQEITLNHVYDFIKPPSAKASSELLVGKGLALAEGDSHKRQRKMMNPAFVYGNIKEMVPTFLRITSILKNLIEDKLNQGESEINLTNPISNTTLDIIGLVGFNYEFNSLSSPNELANAYSSVLNSTKDNLGIAIMVLSNLFPIIGKVLLQANKQYNDAFVVIKHVSRKLVLEKKNESKNGKLKGKDLLSYLININNELPDEEKLTDEELIPQVMTFLFAGHETTSTATCWALYLLSINQREQDLLREELVKAFPDKSNFNPTYDEINALEYLNCIVKETLRIRSPVSASSRYNLKEKVFGGHLIPEGTTILIPMSTIHKDTSIWGSDATEFNPKRWLDPEITKKISNTNYLPFLTGTRVCIGNKIALTEFKVLLSMFIRNFVFHPIEGFHISTRSFPSLSKPEPYLKLKVSKVEG